MTDPTPRRLKQPADAFEAYRLMRGRVSRAYRKLKDRPSVTALDIAVTAVGPDHPALDAYRAEAVDFLASRFGRAR